MGSHSMQAVGGALFLAGFTFISPGWAAEENVLLIALAIAALGASLMVSYKIKPWEHAAKFCSLARVAVW